MLSKFIKAERLRCPSSYQQAAVEVIEMMNSTSTKCSKECYMNKKCKAFTVLNPESADPTIKFQQDILCIMTAMNLNEDSEMKTRLCVKKISKLDWNGTLLHNFKRLFRIFTMFRI